MILGMLIVLIIAILVGIITKRDTCECIFTSILCITLILFVFGILKFFIVGMFLIVIISILSLYRIISDLIKHKVKINEIFTCGTIVYIAFMIVLYFFYRGSYIMNYDEFTAWGLFAKTTYLSKELYIFSPLPALAKNYMSGTAIFQSFLEIMNFKYLDSVLFFGMQAIYFSLAVPLLKQNKIKNIFRVCIYSIIFAAIPLSMYLWPVAYYSILVDTILGLIFGFIIYYYFTNEYSRFKQINLALLCFFICCSKGNGFILGGMGLFLIYFDMIILNFNKFKETIKINKKNSKIIRNINYNELFMVFFPGIALILTYLLWNLLIKSINILPQNFSFDANSIIFAYRTENFKNWINEFLNVLLTIKREYFNYFLLTMASLVFLITYNVKILFNKKNIMKLVKVVLNIIVFIILIILYIYFLFSVCSTMSGWQIAIEALRRYLYTIVASILLLSSFYIIYISIQKKFYTFPIITIIILFVSTPFNFQSKNFINRLYKQETINYRNSYPLSNGLVTKVNYKYDKVFIAYSNEIDIHIVNYMASPITVTNIPQFDDDIDSNVFGQLLIDCENVQPYHLNIYTKEEAELTKSRQTGKTFLYIYNISDESLEIFNKILEKEQIRVNNNSLFEIKYSDNDVLFIKQ